MDTNKVFLMGNLTRDVELITTKTGKTKAKFTIATNRKYKDATGAPVKETTFTKIIAWEGLANSCAKFIRKGHRVLVTGRLITEKYETEPGKKVEKTAIVAEDVEFLTPKAMSGISNNSTEPF